MTENKTDPKAQAEKIAERIVSGIKWTGDLEGFCTCPGDDSHTTKTAGKDCKIYLDGTPTIYCFHQGCQQEVEEASRRLRAALGDAGLHFDAAERKPGKGDNDRIGQIREKERIRKKAEALRERVLQLFPWPYEQMAKDSPVALKDNLADHWKLLLGLFRPEDVVWIGEKTDSGRPQHAANFKKVQDWLKDQKVPGPFTCPATFKPGSQSRSNEQVLTRRFLVVESDTLDKDQVGAVFRWIQTQVELPLRAIVDTAGKSLHGWFNFPNLETEDDLRAILPALGCDVGMFRASQPCRLPSFERTEGEFQRLIYLQENKTRE